MKKIIDLSMEIYSGMELTWWKGIGHTMVMLDSRDFADTAPLFKEPCKGFAEKMIIMGDHAGTHVDSPYHFHPEKLDKTIDKLPLDKFIGEAVLIDVSFKQPDEPVTMDVLRKALKEQEIEVKEGDIVLFRIWPGFGEKGWWDYNGLTEDVAKWLIDKKVKAVGVNTGLDYRYEMRRIVHVTLLGAEIPGIELLVNLEKIKKKRFLFIGLPLKLRGATASPIRAVAVVDDP